MGRSPHYKSPKKLKRSYQRLISHIIKMQNKVPILKAKQLAFKRTPKLEVSKVSITNFPEPCSVCNLPQCEIDDRHTFHFMIASTITRSINEAFSKYDRKPPDVCWRSNFSASGSFDPHKQMVRFALQLIVKVSFKKEVKLWCTSFVLLMWL